ncbi:hypothetical protein ANCCAN_28413 [Ancylostoma caninum]|uniref:Reverse transcriptase/retrotransposon-derived protein RNase H-like domain-containing protein n=1 Tax=Ancylostoma caninum TaxID=29170 RepID=A0A368F1E4_ANCCA|nr:hypothetical protein ANCCAN_28413 [Ancylostoma caninum]
MASCYRESILKFVKITRCLYQTISPKTRWRWTEREEKASEEMKPRLTQAPILAQPDMEGAAYESNPFVIFTDASTHGLGAVLCQQGKDGFLHPIYFVSKKLSKAVVNYHVKNLGALAKYRLEVQYVAGKGNAVADALLPGATTGEEHERVVCPENEMIVCRTAAEESEWLKKLRQDDDYWELISALEAGRTDLGVKMQRSNKRLVSADFTLDEGHLKLVQERSLVKVVPKSRREKLIRVLEGVMMGHFSPR